MTFLLTTLRILYKSAYYTGIVNFKVSFTKKTRNVQIGVFDKVRIVLLTFLFPAIGFFHYRHDIDTDEYAIIFNIGLKYLFTHIFIFGTVLLILNATFAENIWGLIMDIDQLETQVKVFEKKKKTIALHLLYYCS